MKSKTIIIIACFLLCLLAFRPLINDTSSLGEVKISLLPPSQFSIVNGNSWVLIDGRNISGSNLDLFLKSNNLDSLLTSGNIPDLRGNFIRAVGENNLRKVGTFQKNSTKIPADFNIDVTTGGSNHQHKINGKVMQKEGADTKLVLALDVYSPEPHHGTKFKKTEKDGKHSHVARWQGGSEETRPDNVSFYIYMKIN